MSSFNCEHCGTAILDTPGGEYVTECEHYQKKELEITAEDEKINSILDFIREEDIKKAAKESALSQRIQMAVWDYMDLPKHKRDATELAQAIIEDCKKTL